MIVIFVICNYLVVGLYVFEDSPGKQEEGGLAIGP